MNEIVGGVSASALPRHLVNLLTLVFLDQLWLVAIMGLDAVARLGVSILSDGDQVSVDSITLFVALLCGCIVIGHLLEESRWINDSITALVIVSPLSFIESMLFVCTYIKDIACTS